MADSKCITAKPEVTQTVDTGIECPLTSCKDVLDNGKSTGSGYYEIDIDGTGPYQPFQVYCDMTTVGGGWTIIDKNFIDEGLAQGFVRFRGYAHSITSANDLVQRGTYGFVPNTSKVEWIGPPITNGWSRRADNVFGIVIDIPNKYNEYKSWISQYTVLNSTHGYGGLSVVSDKYYLVEQQYNCTTVKCCQDGFEWWHFRETGTLNNSLGFANQCGSGYRSQYSTGNEEADHFISTIENNLGSIKNSYSWSHNYSGETITPLVPGEKININWGGSHNGYGCYVYQIDKLMYR